MRKDIAVKLISSDRTKCVKCGACVEVCPMGVIGVAEDGFPEPKNSAYRLCINCGYCVDICLFDALNHRFRRRAADSDAAMKRYEAMQKKRKGELK